MSNLPACGLASPVGVAILSILAPPGGTNPTKLAAATAYVETQLQPIVTSIDNDVSNVISTNYLVLLFIVLIAVLAIVLWICATLAVEGWIVAGLVLLILVVAVASLLAFQSYASALVTRTLDAAASSLSTQITAGMLLSTLNGAAQEYLATIGISC